MLGIKAAYQKADEQLQGDSPTIINHQSVVESAYSAIIQRSSLLYVHCSQERRDNGVFQWLEQ